MLVSVFVASVYLCVCVTRSCVTVMNVDRILSAPKDQSVKN